MADPSAALIGAWELVAWQLIDPDGDVVEPFGPAPQGLLVYGADGFMSVVITAPDRPRLPDDPAARAFISECSASATWLVRSLEQRARTILKVATEIVRRQERFFGLGIAELRPLTRRAVAEELGLHESTVSRVIAHKYLACEQGCFPFSHFFSAAIRATAGGEAFSATAVQERIRALVQGEPAARTLSDDRIVALLYAEGIDIARRTVAKYREGMGIPSSVERRRLKGPLAGHRPGAGPAR